MSDLRPCPWEKENANHELQVYHDGMDGELVVECIDCGYLIPKNRWNNRPQLDTAIEAFGEIAESEVYTERESKMVYVAQEALSELKGDA